jgi:hypothetical protein
MIDRRGATVSLLGDLTRPPSCGREGAGPLTVVELRGSALSHDPANSMARHGWHGYLIVTVQPPWNTAFCCRGKDLQVIEHER